MPKDIGNIGIKMNGIDKTIPATTASFERADVDSRDDVRDRVTIPSSSINGNHLYQKNGYKKLDFKHIAQTILPHAETIINQLGLHGKKSGKEFTATNPTRSDKSLGSFKINLITGKWSDFATGDKGGDLISLYAYVNHIDQKNAALELSNQFGLDYQVRSISNNHKSIVIPKNIPDVPHDLIHGNSGVWKYHDAQGNVCAYVARFDNSNGKSFMPITVGETDWQCKGLSQWPLYNLHLIVENPAKTVMVCEGEKAADAAQKMFPEYVVTTSQGGSNSYNKTDWRPLKGRNIVIWRDADEAGEKYQMAVIDILSKIGVKNINIVDIEALKFNDGYDAADYLKDGKDINDITVNIKPAYHDSSKVKYNSIEDTKMKKINWLWPDRIARGKVSFIAGNPGLGKSQITASLSAIVSNGGKFPVDNTGCDVGNVIILSAEDDLEDTIAPRLAAAGANLKRCFYIQATMDDDNNEKHFSLIDDLEELGKMIVEIRGAALIIIDPITAYLGKTDSHNTAEVRGLLAPLSKLAEKHNVAILCISHLNKGGNSTDALMRVTGSVAFVAAARAAYIVAEDKEDPQRRLFLPLKNNLGNDKTGLAFNVQGHTLDNGISTSRINWLPDIVTITANEAVKEKKDNSPPRESAKDFLLKILADGSKSVNIIREETDSLGIGWRTIETAKKELCVKAIKIGGMWYWSLAPKIIKLTPENNPF